MGGGAKSKSSKSKSHRPHSLHVKRGKSGGFIVTHHHAPADDGTQEPDEDHVVGSMDDLHQHMDDAMGDQGPAPSAAPEPVAQAAPAQAAPAPQPGM